MQGVTQTPFRVVDEINQGMDPVNERKVRGAMRHERPVTRVVLALLAGTLAGLSNPSLWATAM